MRRAYEFSDYSNERAVQHSAVRTKLVSYVLMAAISIGASYVSLSLMRAALVEAAGSEAFAQIFPDVQPPDSALTRFLQTPVTELLQTPWLAETPRRALDAQATAVRGEFADSTHLLAPRPANARTPAPPRENSRIESAEVLPAREDITVIARQLPAARAPAMRESLHFVHRGDNSSL